MKRLFLFVLPLLFLTCCLGGYDAYAADVCVGASATGNGSGSDWNNQSQWSTLSFARGNMYYLADGTYGAKTLGTPVSGSTYIYIKKATASAHGTETGWVSTMGDGVATFTGGLTVSTSYWDISGVTGGGPGNWTLGHGFAFSSAVASAVTYIVITSGSEYINIRHSSFVQTGNPTTAGTGGTAIYCNGNVSNSIFEYNYFNNLVGLPFLLRGGSGNSIQYNYTGDICGMWIYNGGHCEALVQHSMNDVHFRWNYIGECPSTGGFVKNNSGTTSDGIRIYGNIFSNGMPISVDGTATNWRVFNNTFIGMIGGPISMPGAFGASNLFYNNLIYNSSMGFLPATHKYNWFSSIKSNNCSTGGNATENIVVRYPNSCDIVTETSNPFVNSSGTAPEDFRLVLSGRHTGTDVCALDACTGEIKYNIDAFGTTRSGWDIGAYEYADTNDISPPRQLRIVY